MAEEGDDRAAGEGDDRTAEASSDAAVATDDSEPTAREVVDVASEAAEGVVFSRYRRSEVRDVDVSVGFEDGLLEVDVYLNVPDADDAEHVDDEAEQVAEDAAAAAVEAVDRLFAERAD